MKGEKIMFDPQVDVIVPCVWCDSVHSISMPASKLVEWRTSGKVMETFHDSLSAGDRELLISGTCDDCWTRLFGKDEESCEFNQDIS